jgi:anti-sigma-K factor RskA
MPANRDATIVRLPQDAGEVTAVAVSVEPAGGSLQPTSKPIAVAVL